MDRTEQSAPHLLRKAVFQPATQWVIYFPSFFICLTKIVNVTLVVQPSLQLVG